MGDVQQLLPMSFRELTQQATNGNVKDVKLVIKARLISSNGVLQIRGRSLLGYKNCEIDVTLKDNSKYRVKASATSDFGRMKLNSQIIPDPDDPTGKTLKFEDQLVVKL